MTSIFDNMRRVLFAHAHPDDETLATGALIQHLTRAGTSVAVVTATRGERGEVVDGPLAHLAGTPELDAHREAELAEALRALGTSGPHFLGQPPARREGLPARRYRDSGMRWVTPTLAGPSADAGPDALTSAHVEEAALDLAAFAHHFGPDLIISYGADGGYGHPDHVHMHHAARRAAALTGVRFAEVVSIPRDGRAPAEDGIEWFDNSGHLDALLPALEAHASQYRLDGTQVIHVGGQREQIHLRTGLRER